ncbi:uncharacterized protein TNCV_2943971 [Trichonephila clavipes]|nr:uncharacterized protein TNCV_2943971 [Trichonephila clavipes]
MTIVFVCGDPVVKASILPLLYSDTPLHSWCEGMGFHCYNTRPSLVLIRDTMQAWRYVHDILQPHVLPLMQRFQGQFFDKSIFISFIRQGCHKTVSALLLHFIGLLEPQICLQSSISVIIWDGELSISRVERTRGKVTVNLELKISR